MTAVVSAITIDAPSRLELTLIDLSLGSRRVNGSAGIAISYPHFECRVTSSVELAVDPPTFEYASEVREFLTRLLARLKCEPVIVDVRSSIPIHQGFGSKTATLLAVGRATAALYEREISTPELALLARRARTSGVGVNIFDRGGFLVDGGHPVDPNQDDHNRFVPTRFSDRTHIPRPIFSHPLPWPIVVVLPHGVTIEGPLELERFRALFPMPRASAHELAYIASFLMTTAVVEEDYGSFCAAVNDLQRAYLKANELEFQSPEVRRVFGSAISKGFDAIGLSSNGPALYGFTRSPEMVERWMQELLTDGTITSYWWTTSPRSGAILRRENIEVCR